MNVVMKYSTRKLRMIRESYLFNRSAFWKELWAHLQRGGQLVEFTLKKDIRYRTLFDQINSEVDLKEQYEESLRIGRLKMDELRRAEWKRYREMGLLKMVT